MHLVEYDASDVMAMVELADRPRNNNNNNNNNDGNSTPMPSLGVHVYRDLVQAFLAVDRPTFDDILHEHESLFRSDGHYGLIAGPVATTLRYREVYTVSSLYATLPLAQLATELQVPEAEARSLLEHLALRRQWPVTLEQLEPTTTSDGMMIVVFPAQPPASGENRSDVLLSPDELLQLTHKVREMDAAVQSSSKYAAQVMRHNKAREKGSDAPRGVEDI